MDKWQATLQSGLGRTRLVLRLTGALDSEQSQECAWKALDEVVPEGASVVLDITHGFRHQPVVVAFTVTLLRWLRQVEQVDLFYGAFEMRRADGVAPVLQLPVCNTLLHAAEAVATLSHTGDFVPLAQTLHLEPQTQQEMERIAFLEETYQEPRMRGRQILAKLEQAPLTPVDQSLRRLLARAARKRPDTGRGDVSNPGYIADLDLRCHCPGGGQGRGEPGPRPPPRAGTAPMLSAVPALSPGRSPQPVSNQIMDRPTNFADKCRNRPRPVLQ